MFRVRVPGLGFRVWSLGFGVWGKEGIRGSNPYILRLPLRELYFYPLLAFFVNLLRATYTLKSLTWNLHAPTPPKPQHA